MDTFAKWVVVMLVFGLVYYYYGTQSKPKVSADYAASIIESAGSQPAKKREQTKLKSKKDGRAGAQGVSESEHAEISASGKEKKKKRKTAKAMGENVGIALTSETRESSQDKVDENVDKNDGHGVEIDNDGFAKMLSEMRSNKPIVKPQLKKNVEAQDAPANSFSRGMAHLSVAGPDDVTARGHSTTSSTTGADADDDLSPVGSPFIEPKSVGNAYEGSGVSDMLESSGSGPAILRLTGSKQTPRAQKPKPQEFQTQETKKQRQNRKKVEAKKAEREEAEKERRTLLERQRRTAREAEGRAAKNGMGSVSKPSANSAWTAPQKADTAGRALAAPVTTSDIPYLDTFEGSEKAQTGNSGAGHNASRGKSDTPVQNWKRDLPSEEEQMRIISEMNDVGWNTVSGTKKGKKKGTLNNDQMGNESSGPEKKVESSKPNVLPKGTLGSRSGNSDVWGFDSAPPRIVVKKDDSNSDDWVVDGGWEGNSQ